MLNDFRRALVASATVVGLGTTLVACGGGGGGGAADTTQAPATTSSADTVSNASDTSSVDTVSPVKPVDGTSSADSGFDLTTAIAGSATVATGAVLVANSGGSGAPANAAPTNVAPAAVAASRSGIGLNLGVLSNISPEFPTIDLMKRAGAWYVGCNIAFSPTCTGFTGKARAFDTLEEASLDLDAQGWIKSLPSNADTTLKFRFATTVISSGVVPDGKYIVRYDGTGTLSYSGMAKKVVAESTPGRDVVQMTNSSTGGFFLTVNATTPGNYLRNIRVYPPGGACANDYTTFAASADACSAAQGAFVPFESFPANQPWYPPFITDAKGFRTLRFLEWTHANTTMLSDWSTRPLPTDRTWSGPYGAPVETMVDVANATGADPWINLPAHATDDYVHQFGHLVHDRLATNLHLNLEYSNETWNYSFAQTKWMKDQGAAQWPTELANGANPYTLGYNWYAQRLVQVCNIVKQEFGADASRVRCIANTQAANAPQTAQVLACKYAAGALGKPCGKLIDAVAVAPYFGYYLGNPSNRPTVQSWYSDPDGGLSKLFAELNGVTATGSALSPSLMAAFPNGARGMSKGWMTTSKAAADVYGLPLWAYEGGQHLVPPQGDTDATFLALITAANRDPRMGTAYDQDFADWKASGGQVFAYYDHVSLPSRYGAWGLKLSLTDNAAPKWQAVVRARDSGCWWSGC